jgi:hypothetical protein
LIFPVDARTLHLSDDREDFFMSHCFISYDHADSNLAGELIGKLDEARIPVWKDSLSLRAGEDWRVRIDEGIKAAFALIVVVTPRAMVSEYVSYEWACGVGAGAKVIPLLMEASQLHARLSAMHYLDFTDPARRPWDALIQELRKACEERAVVSVQVPANAPLMVKKAVEALDSLEPEQQAQAIKALGQIDHRAARDALAGAVQHPSRDVRIKAALELSRFKDPRAVPGLIDAQRAWQLRWEFVRTMVRIGPAAVPGLLAAINDDDAELREYAAHALGEIKEMLALPALEKLIKDPVASVREAATKAMERISGL